MPRRGLPFSVLQGAAQLLTKRPKPVLLVEVQDIRTKPWGYPASEIIEYVSRAGYQRFALDGDGSLCEIDAKQQSYDGNFVAVPEEQVAAMFAYLHGRKGEARKPELV